MTKLFMYELRRLLINKFFIGLLAVCALYSWILLSNVIILGVANTAPFSGWSYGAFLSSMMPVLLIALLFFISFLYSKQEKEMQRLIDATPLDPYRFSRLRCGAIITGFLLIAAVPIGMSLRFYAVNFDFTGFRVFVLPAIITLLPAMLFVLGLGMAVGRVHPVLVYVLMPLILFGSNLPDSYGADLMGMHFFWNFPAQDVLWTNGEPEFSIPTAVWVWKAAYSAIGFILILRGRSRRFFSRKH